MVKLEVALAGFAAQLVINLDKWWSLELVFLSFTR
jgi:hypothetical protein